MLLVPSPDDKRSSRRISLSLTNCAERVLSSTVFDAPVSSTSKALRLLMRTRTSRCRPLPLRSAKWSGIRVFMCNYLRGNECFGEKEGRIAPALHVKLKIRSGHDVHAVEHVHHFFH